MPVKIRRPGKLAAQVRYHKRHLSMLETMPAESRDAEWEQSRERHALRYERLSSMLVGAGRCTMCGRTLTDPESVMRGIGPDCYAKQVMGS